MTPIRLGFVGLSSKGWAAWMLAPPLVKPPLSNEYTLSAVSTSNRASANATAEQYSKLTNAVIKSYYGPTTAIAGDAELDMVAVAVKAPDHKAAVMPIIEAGKDLFIEWPAGRNLAETREIAEAAKEKGIRTMVGLQGRQSALIMQLREIVASGKIGNIMSSTVSARPFRELYAWGPYISQATPFTAQSDNGATMLDIAVGHFLDTFTWVLGPFNSLSAVVENQHPTAQLVDEAGKPTGVTIEQTGPSQVAVSGSLANGAIVNLHWRGGLESKGGKAGTPFLWTIDGDKGSIRIESDDPGGSFLNVRDPVMFLNGEEVHINAPNSMSNTERAWAEFAKRGNYPTLEDAVRNKMVLNAISTSAREGHRVYI